MSEVKFHTSKDKIWQDAKGLPVPYSRVLPPERKKEKYAKQLHDMAKKIETDLGSLWEHANAICAELYKEAMDALAAEGKAQTKGNFRWYNFDKSVRIEVDMQDRLEYDSLKLAAAKAKFDEYITKHTAGADDLITTLVADAFTNTKGRVDNKKIQTLISYKNRFTGAKYALWHQGCDLLIEAAEVVSSKRYTTFSLRQPDGSYKAINLNFSSI